MGKKWVAERKRDAYYKKAKAENYRSRASYKLIQIHEKFGIFEKGDRVLDLGASPGGWSQVAVELTAPKGFVLGIDLAGIQPMHGAKFVTGDIALSEVQDMIAGELYRETGFGRFNVIISDLSPNISGNYSVDHANSIYLCEAALELAHRLLKHDGSMVMKVFEGDLFKDLVKGMKKKFTVCKPYGPPASRSQSSEIYLVGKGFTGGADG